MFTSCGMGADMLFVSSGEEGFADVLIRGAVCNLRSVMQQGQRYRTVIERRQKISIYMTPWPAYCV